VFETRISRDPANPVPFAKEALMLSLGDKAPDFTVKTHRGETLSLSDLRGRHVLLWFYPKADTPG